MTSGSARGRLGCGACWGGGGTRRIGEADRPTLSLFFCPDGHKKNKDNHHLTREDDEMTIVVDTRIETIELMTEKDLEREVALFNK